MEQSDSDLAAAVLRCSSEAAFVALYHRHSKRIYRVALRITQDAHDAEDVLQETWLRATAGLPAFRWRSSLSTWLTGIAANVSRELMQRNRRWATSGECADVAVVTSEFIDLERAIAALPPAERAVLILHDVEGFTHREIAQLLHWHTGTSKSQLHRARRSIAGRLGRLQPELKNAT